MALVDEVKKRFSTQHLTNLTNPQAEEQTGIDNDRLLTACEDVEYWIEVKCGVVYDNTDKRQRAIAIMGVQELLRIYTGQTPAEEATSIWLGWLNALAKVTGRDRMLPVTTSRLQPSIDPGTPPIPEFDRRRLVDLTPDAPGEGEPYTSP